MSAILVNKSIQKSISNQMLCKQDSEKKLYEMDKK